MDHQGTVRLETPRLILRKVESSDAEAMFANWKSDPQVSRYMSWDPHQTVVDTRRYLTEKVLPLYGSPDHYEWGIVWKATGEIIGDIGTSHNDENGRSAFIGYGLSRGYWGKGIMAEALERILRFLLDEVGYRVVYAKHVLENRQSGRVMQKAGMEKIGELTGKTKASDQGIYCLYEMRKTE